MLSEQQQRIMGYFIEEAKDHLGTIEQGLLNLKPTLEDPEMANEIFRAAHSVKGGAAMLGLTSIQNTAHRLEDYFKILKECDLQIDQKLETMLLRVFDTLQELVEQLRGPFGLTDDKAEEAMTAVEPVFVALNQHLEQLVSRSGIRPPEDVTLMPATPLVRTQPAQAASEESALRFIFQNDVPARLRDMLQLFKQPDSAASRQQLQAICQILAQSGEQLDLPEWCDLMDSAEQAIRNPDNTYRTLAPIVIKDIKRAQEQVLGGDLFEVAASDDLIDLLPPELDSFGDVGVAAADSDADLTDLLGFDDSGFDQVAAQPDLAAEPPDFDVSLFELPEALPEDLPALPTDLPELDLWAEDELSIGAVDAGMPQPQSGPNMGASELNTLADLFEGEDLDLGLTWQEEVMEGASDSAPELELSPTNDFSDLLSSNSSTEAAPEVDWSDLLNSDTDQVDEPPAAASEFDFSEFDLSFNGTVPESLPPSPPVEPDFELAELEPFGDLDLDPNLELDLPALSALSAVPDTELNLELGSADLFDQPEVEPSAELDRGFDDFDFGADSDLDALNFADFSDPVAEAADAESGVPAEANLASDLFAQPELGLDADTGSDDRSEPALDFEAESDFELFGASEISASEGLAKPADQADFFGLASDDSAQDDLFTAGLNFEPDAAAEPDHEPDDLSALDLGRADLDLGAELPEVESSSLAAFELESFEPAGLGLEGFELDETEGFDLDSALMFDPTAPDLDALGLELETSEPIAESELAQFEAIDNLQFSDLGSFETADSDALDQTLFELAPSSADLPDDSALPEALTFDFDAELSENDGSLDLSDLGLESDWADAILTEPLLESSEEQADPFGFDALDLEMGEPEPSFNLAGEQADETATLFDGERLDLPPEPADPAGSSPDSELDLGLDELELDASLSFGAEPLSNEDPFELNLGDVDLANLESADFAFSEMSSEAGATGEALDFNIDTAAEPDIALDLLGLDESTADAESLVLVDDELLDFSLPDSELSGLDNFDLSDLDSIGLDLDESAPAEALSDLDLADFDPTFDLGDLDSIGLDLDESAPAATSSGLDLADFDPTFGASEASLDFTAGLDSSDASLELGNLDSGFFDLGELDSELLDSDLGLAAPQPEEEASAFELSDFDLESPASEPTLDFGDLSEAPLDLGLDDLETPRADFATDLIFDTSEDTASENTSDSAFDLLGMGAMGLGAAALASPPTFPESPEPVGESVDELNFDNDFSFSRQRLMQTVILT